MTARRRPIVPAAVGLLAAALIALLVYGVVHGGTNHSLDDAVIAGKLPAAPSSDLRRPLLDGSGQRSLADYRGKILVLNFWASWCGPCGVEAPVLERLQAKLAHDGTGTVLGATYNDAPADSNRFERQHHITYPSVRDVGTDLANAYGTKALPETFVIDAQGRVVAVSRGQVSQRFLDNAIAKATGDTAA